MREAFLCLLVFYLVHTYEIQLKTENDLESMMDDNAFEGIGEITKLNHICLKSSKKNLIKIFAFRDISNSTYCEDLHICQSNRRHKFCNEQHNISDVLKLLGPDHLEIEIKPKIDYPLPNSYELRNAIYIHSLAKYGNPISVSHFTEPYFTSLVAASIKIMNLSHVIIDPSFLSDELHNIFRNWSSEAIDNCLQNIQKEGNCSNIHRSLESHWALSLITKVFRRKMKLFLGSQTMVDTVCVSELFANLNGFTLINPFGKEKVLPYIRSQIYSYYGLNNSRLINNKKKTVLIYTRGDATTRQLNLKDIKNYENSSNYEYHILTKMPSHSFDLQVKKYHEADIVIAPHGSNNMNSIFMRSNTIYMEIRPNCIENCLNKCIDHYSDQLVGNNLTVSQIVLGSEIEACAIRTNPYGPTLHSFSDINFYVQYRCIGGARCVEGKEHQEGHYLLNGKIDNSHRAFKYNWNSKMTFGLDDLEIIVDFLEGSNPKKLSDTRLPIRVNSFSTVCN